MKYKIDGFEEYKSNLSKLKVIIDEIINFDIEEKEFTDCDIEKIKELNNKIGELRKKQIFM